MKLRDISKPWAYVVLLLSFLAPLAFWETRPHAQESAPPATPAVSEAELQRYIAVYKSMQADHALTIEEAIRPHGVSLEEFRALERRVQENPRLVEQVRNALLEYARSNSALVLSTVPTPSPTPPAGKRERRHK